MDLQGDTEGSRAAIKDWVAEQTRGRIPELLPKGFVNPRSVYVLLNTVYLKAEWQQIFGKYPTEPAPFTRPDRSPVEVDLMHKAELEGRYLVENGLAVTELPYMAGSSSCTCSSPMISPRSSSGSTCWSETASRLL